MCPLHLASEIDDSWRTQTQKQKKKEDTDERHGVLPERSAGVRIPRIITLGGRVALARNHTHAVCGHCLCTSASCCARASALSSHTCCWLLLMHGSPGSSHGSASTDRKVANGPTMLLCEGLGGRRHVVIDGCADRFFGA